MKPEDKKSKHVSTVKWQVYGEEADLKIFACNQDFRAGFLAWREANPKWTNALIAPQIGRSPAVVYQYCHPAGNTYSGNTILLERKLMEFMRDSQLLLDSTVASIESEISGEIKNYIEQIRLAKRIGAIIGEPGIGKTRGIDRYCKDHSLAVRFRVFAWQKSQAAFAQCLFRAAELPSPRRGLSGFEELTEKSFGSARPILIDDAHKATGSALQLAYDFRDATGSPVVLFGDERLIAKLKCDAQRLRRTGILYRLKCEESQPLVEHQINSILFNVGDERKEIMDACLKIADGPGHFGRVESVLSLAAWLKRKDNKLNWVQAVKGAQGKLIAD